MKNLKWILFVILIALLILMKRFDIIFQTYGVTHNLDMIFGYTADDVYSTLKMLGNNGRNILIQYYITDYIFILCFGAVQLIILKWVLGDKLMNTKLKFLTIIPYLRGTLDFVENTTFISLVLKLPAEYRAIVPGLSFVTQAKLVVYGGWIASIVIIGILRLITKSKEESKEHTTV